MQQASLKSLRTAWRARRKFSIILSMVMVLLTSAIMTSYLGLSHIVGLKSQNTTFKTYGAETEIKIKAAEVAGCESCDISNQYDGIFEYPVCTTTSNWTYGEATFRIPWALVKRVKVIMSDTLGMTTGDHSMVYLCTGGDSCEECGVLRGDSRYASRVEIQEHVEMIAACLSSKLESSEYEVKEVRINKLFPHDYCEVKIYGKMAVNEAVRKIEIHSVAGSQQFNGNFTTMRFSQEHVPANTIDGNLQSDPFYCFVAGSHIDSWLIFHMQWSMVTHVKLMNVGTESTMEGVAVFVCNFPYDSSCLPCGFASETANGGWSTVYCTGGMIEDNQLKIIHPFSRLQLCEVEIYGRDIKYGAGVVSQLDVEHSSEKFLSPVRIGRRPALPWKPENETCLITFYSTAPAFANHVLLHESIVHFIQLLNCDQEDCADLVRVSAKVCQSKFKNCAPCNPVNNAPRGELVTILCPTKPRGRIVEISHPTKLKYCDLQVFGEDDQLTYESWTATTTAFYPWKILSEGENSQSWR